MERQDSSKNEKCWYKDVCDIGCSPCCERFVEMSYLMQESGIPPSKQNPIQLFADNCDFEQYCKLKDIKDNILDFVNTGKNLYICSTTTGNGKTSWALKLLMKYFDMVWAGNGLAVRGLFVHTPTLLLKFKNFNEPLSAEYRHYLENVDLVVWDDIAVTGLTQYDFSNLLMLIDSRTLHDRANIYTSNQIDADSLSKVVGTRLASRIWNLSQVIQLNGTDKRVGGYA